MQLLSGNLEKHMFEEIENCHERIMIISPFLSTYTIKKLIDYIEKKGLNCTIVTRFERKAFIDGASSLEALKILIENNITVLALKDLHSKVYIFDHHTCMIGSANFTKKALTQNHELLMKLTEIEELEPVQKYAEKLIQDIYAFGNCNITIEQIEIEQSIKHAYEENKEEQSILSYSWGAELKTSSTKKNDPNKVVLSVPVGGTHELVKKYFIHAHPDDQYYNYTRLEDLICFRQNHGGRMDAFYHIESTFSLDHMNWEEELETFQFEDSIKNRIREYIIERKRVFVFEKPIPFKFYILTLVEELPHKPRPRTNNSGHRYYTIGHLLSGNEFV